MKICAAEVDKELLLKAFSATYKKERNRVLKRGNVRKL